MLKNYFKIAWRNLVRNKVYSAINILGLAIGISACILIFLYVRDELTYEAHFDKANRIFRITNEINLQGQTDKFALTPFPLADALKKDFPVVEAVTRVMPIGKQTVWYEDKVFSEENFYFADSTFFRIFNYPFLQGDPATALDLPKSIVITEEIARKYFGSSENAMGKVMKFSKNPHKVTGVFRDPGHSHFKLNALLSVNTFDEALKQQFSGDWFRMSLYTYVLLPSSDKKAVFEQNLLTFYHKTVVPWMKENRLTASMKYHLQALPDIHLDNSFTYDLSPAGNKSYVYIFGIVALFILLIACINYMNLATARSAKRAKEVGLRKVIGAHRSQLIKQFVGESVMLTALAILVALALVELLLPYFNSLTEKNFTLSYFSNASFLVVLLLIIVFVGIVGGSYPAFFLSAFKPVDVLKSDKNPRGTNALLRKALVVTQFTISLILIIGTVVVHSQMQFLKNNDLGFNKEQVVVIDIPGGDTTLVNRLNTIKHEFLASPSVKKVATSAFIPGDKVSRLLFYAENNETGKMEEKTISSMFVDYDFLEMMEIKLAAGRNFSRDIRTDDSMAFIINETAARWLGYQNPVGKNLENGLGLRGKIIGVVKDFHFTSLHNKIEPLAIMLAPKTQGFLLVRVEQSNLPGTLAFIEEKWKAFDRKHPMEYFFLDENFNKQYRSEEKMLTVFGYFAALTILIACLGLFGLASFTAEQRTKEIGIRKVLGSSVSEIMLLLSKDFAWLVLIAVALASPLAWYSMHHWLRNFAYRTEIHWWIFAIAGFIALTIAMLTVSFQAAKAARLNPIKALRSE
ncbi:ABC transporter permease [Adhaeribacter soli]|uniref:FtsX-like permease family protein n=1 Tax=Adhaeribacter soli TaxID=2607655 RepID=A0A5N1J381_9BACT|nr:ABC transporter permease [Adhaeribacter soli]KAA9340555.1 FtsX-like permease family protein [Adhaeribacter soli]